MLLALHNIDDRCEVFLTVSAAVYQDFKPILAFQRTGCTP